MKTYKVESKKGLYPDYFVGYYTEIDYNLIKEKVELWYSDLFAVTIL